MRMPPAAFGIASPGLDAAAGDGPKGRLIGLACLGWSVWRGAIGLIADV